MLRARVFVPLALAAFAAPWASAQLVFGTTTTSTSNPAAMYYDVTSGTVTTLWNSASNKKVNGLAADPVTHRLYANDSARLNYWDYGNLGTAPTFIAGMYRTNDNVTFTATGCDGLAFTGGKLYGMATPHCVMTPVWLDTSAGGGTTSLGGLEFNPADNQFYVTSTVDTTGAGGIFGLGVYKIDAFGGGAVTKVTDFPAGRTRIDGMAIGGGKYWLTEQDAPNNRIDIYPYDPVSGTYGTTIYVPLTDGTNRASGAAWAPGALTPAPAGLGLAAIGAGALLRRRRNA